MNKIVALASILNLFFFTAGCNDGGDKKKDPAPAPQAEQPTTEQPTTDGSGGAPANTGGDSGGGTGDPAPAAVTKSLEVNAVSGTLALTTEGLGLTGFNLANPETIACKDALDGATYDSGVTVGSDGSFSCPNVPKCYAKNCTNANPVVVNVVDEATGKAFCTAPAGEAGVVCDVAACFSAAATELPDNLRECLTEVNAAAAAVSFQSALNKAYAMGEIALDKYTLSECINMTNDAKATALAELVEGSLTEFLVDSLDKSLQKELDKCKPEQAQPISTMDLALNFFNIQFYLELGGTEYDAEKTTAGTMANDLEIMVGDAKAIQLAVAAGTDPQTLVDNGTISKESLTYQFQVYCTYSDNEGDEGALKMPLNGDETDFGTCPAQMTRHNSSLDLSGYALGSDLKFPNINDPQGLHSSDDDSGGPGFPYLAFKKIAANPSLTFSLNDIYNIFFTNDAGLKFRMQAWVHDGNNGKQYVISGDGTATEMTNDNRSSFASNDFAPTIDQVFGLLTNTTHKYDMKKLLSLKVHRGWNPTGQEYFYVSGKESDGKQVPVSCDILNADNEPAGLNLSDVTISCTATDNPTNMKRFFVNGTGNDAFLRLINRNNGQEVRTREQSPVYLQALNVSPGNGMPTCTAANQVSVYKYVKNGDHDDWLDGRVIKTLCIDFASLKNAAEYYLIHHVETTIGNNNWSTHVMGGEDSNGDVSGLCVGSSDLTVTEVAGCQNSSTGAYTACAGDASTCDCDWENGEYPRETQVLTTPGDGSLTLSACSSSSGYYFSQYWEEGSKNSASSLKLEVIDASDGQRLEERNTAYDPSVVTTYISAAFTACKDSDWCWRREDIKDLAAHTDIPEHNSWMKHDIVNFYCHQNQDDATIKTECAKLNDAKPITISLAKFANAANAASGSNFRVYENNAYFSHMKQPNPNYNRIFDFETFTFRYANYDPFCDDINNDGKCSFSNSANADIFLSDIWRFNSDYALFSPVALTGYTHDTNNDLFPAEPANWTGNWWETYINPVFNSIGGATGLACSNDRSIKLGWDDMQIYENNNWRDTKEDTCGSDSAYFVVRNIKPNKNTYLVDRPDQIQSMFRMAFGNLDKKAITLDDKRFDFIQALSVFIVSIDVPPVTIAEDGSYVPVYPTIGGKKLEDTWTGFTPVAYNGDLNGLIDLFITVGGGS